MITVYYNNYPKSVFCLSFFIKRGGIINSALDSVKISTLYNFLSHRFLFFWQKFKPFIPYLCLRARRLSSYKGNPLILNHQPYLQVRCFNLVSPELMTRMGKHCR